MLATILFVLIVSPHPTATEDAADDEDDEDDCRRRQIQVIIKNINPVKNIIIDKMAIPK